VSAIGTYPTPIQLLESLSTKSCSLWIKRDDLTHPVYGGSKVRKLGRLLDDAAEVGASRIVTLGAVGSHHVLSTGIFGKLAGLEVEAVALRQPQSEHVLETLRASIGQGVRLFPADSYAEAARYLAASAADGAYLIPAGGSSRLGTLGVLEAATELAAQVAAGELPEPDLLVVPLGSGGTVGGLLAGLAQARLRTRVLAVAVADPVKLFAHKARALAKELVDDPLRPHVLERLEIERRYLGDGYGYATAAGDHATRCAARLALVLDATYTAKAFAAALDRVALGAERHILFWHTLSGAPLAPLLIGAPLESELDSSVRRLAHG
jgi:1-aminocyclopropane-1-carboxylate deaminase/D-cysteine desulfhydrase-like pyridoxal-dependent ACC family enzyme